MRTIGACASCHRSGEIVARGLCSSCRGRFRRDKTITEWGRTRADRVEDYAWLTRECGEPLPAAAARVGVCERTAWRYEKQLRTDPTTEREAA